MLLQEGHHLLLVLISNLVLLDQYAVLGMKKRSGDMPRFPLNVEVFELVAAFFLQEGPQLPEPIELSPAAGLDSHGRYRDFALHRRCNKEQRRHQQKVGLNESIKIMADAIEVTNTKSHHGSIHPL
eukprot:CAMPEP_0170170374 /NCGR_PEP_ID=MMETSP0040_2-20121228/3368_1 /TAXON_ID=641309 /ORGANISM="Lotharella oceanica, Strain CCMP622" /LENGTH=125 /DNA_ID=CAMNT_0010409745 /DNA_START=597 /DNA_END=974 /DNA_ORIENTATION=+